MSVIINRQIRENRWSHLSDDDPLAAGDVTVSLDRWLGERETLAARDGRVGVRLLPGDDIGELGPLARELDLIVIQFDSFAEGRGYSQAYLLRERYGFGGELRALGARRDHVAYMERCGINAFEPAAPDTAEQLLAGFDEITERYQPSHDRVPLIFRKRTRSEQQDVKETSL